MKLRALNALMETEMHWTVNYLSELLDYQP